MNDALMALPSQPAGLAWPTAEWPLGETPPWLDGFLDELFDTAGPMHTTFACVVVHQGRLVAQRYAHHLEHFDRAPEPIAADTLLLSWSMAKSMLHAVVGMLVAEGRLALDEPVDVPEWRGPTDGRASITLDQLLAMRDGLDFVEDYVDDRASDVIPMLFADGKDDVAHYAADRGLIAAPGERFNYSSGTTNIVSGIVARLLGPGAPYEQFIRERLFLPIGMRTATPRFDTAGTWIASSYVYATAQDFARFGYLYLRDGVWDGQRLLPAGWVDHARHIRSHSEEGAAYGSHWWCQDDAFGTFNCAGYEGQYIWCHPALDLIVVRVGRTEAARRPHLVDWRQRLAARFAAG